MQWRKKVICMQKKTNPRKIPRTQADVERAYNAAREEVLESSAYAMSGMPHSPGNSRIAERKAERLTIIESWPETKKMRDGDDADR